jgi:hypothetical protein
MVEARPGALRQNARRSPSILTLSETVRAVFDESLLTSDEEGLTSGVGTFNVTPCTDAHRHPATNFIVA